MNYSRVMLFGLRSINPTAIIVGNFLFLASQIYLKRYVIVPCPELTSQFYKFILYSNMLTVYTVSVFVVNLNNSHGQHNYQHSK